MKVMVHVTGTVCGRVNLQLILRAPLGLHTRKGDLLVTGVSLWAAEPRELAARIRREADARANRA